MPLPAQPPQTELAGVLGVRVLEAMKAHPKLKTQAKLAANSGIAQSSISRILRGEADPAVSTLLAIADALGVSILTLLPERPVDQAAGEDHWTPLTTRAAQRLSPVRRAFVDTAARAAEHGKVSEVECVEHMRVWMQRLAAP
jgi:transcriptional regulator with XRE-family HTH domain